MNQMINKIEARIEALKADNAQIAQSILHHVENNTRNRDNCMNLLANEEKIRELELVIEEMKKS